MLFKKLLALEQVKRWNFHPHLREQSVATHGNNVGMIAYVLADIVHLSEENKNELCVWALFHDFAEAVTGDIPTLVKRFVKDWDDIEGKADIEAAQISSHVEHNGIVPTIRPLPPIVKLADALDAWLYARTECNLGNGMFIAIRDELNGKILEYVASVCKEHNFDRDRLLGCLGGMFGYDFVNASTKDLPEGMSHV